VTFPKVDVLVVESGIQQMGSTGNILSLLTGLKALHNPHKKSETIQQKMLNFCQKSYCR
jgi:hypothetical protein